MHNISSNIKWKWTDAREAIKIAYRADILIYICSLSPMLPSSHVTPTDDLRFWHQAPLYPSGQRHLSLAIHVPPLAHLGLHLTDLCHKPTNSYNIDPHCSYKGGQRHASIVTIVILRSVIRILCLWQGT